MVGIAAGRIVESGGSSVSLFGSVMAKPAVRSGKPCQTGLA